MMRLLSLGKYCRIAAAAALAVLACGGCSGQGAGRGEALDPTPQSSLAAAVRLPALGSLEATRESSALDRIRDGSEYSQLLPSQRVFSAGSAGSFAPAGNAFSDSAYALYSFPLDGYGGPGSIALNWDSAPAAGKCFVAVADFSRNRWQWYAADSADVDFAAAIDFTNSSNRAFVAVLLLGSSIRALNSLEFGSSTPPVAVIHPNYFFVDAGSEISFDGSDSSADSAITKYEWDLNGDGSFETDTGTNAQASFTYPLAGTFTARLRVTDNDGQTAVDSVSVTIGSPGYDETEPNSTVETADLLPGVSFQGWSGNLGAGGYDGSGEDYYLLPVTEPVRLHMVVSMFEPLAELRLQFLDPTGTTVLDEDAGSTGMVINLKIDDPGNYIIALTANDLTNQDYTMDCDVTYGTGYDEVEPNNSPAQANQIDSAGVSGMWANLGTGGYDGGKEDWFKFDVTAANTAIVFGTDYDASLGDIDMELSDGTTTLKKVESPDVFTLSYNFSTPGTYYLRCYLPDTNPPAAVLDYQLNLDNYGEGPQVSIVPSTTSALQGDNISFDASDTTIPAGTSISGFQWDIDGNGYIDHETDGATPTVSGYFYGYGNFTALVRVNLDNGAFGYGTCDFSVQGGNDEVEPNDSSAEAEAKTMPLISFFGDVGPNGNNGGVEDYYKVDMGMHTTLQVVAVCDNNFGALGLALLDTDGETVLEFHNDLDGSNVINTGGLTAGATYYVVVLTAQDIPFNVPYSLTMDYAE